MDIVKPYSSNGFITNDLFDSITKSSAYQKDYQSVKRVQPYNEIEKRMGTAYDVGDMEKNTWRQMNGTIRQEYSYTPIFVNRYYDVINENYERKTPHFMNDFDNRTAVVSGFEYKSTDIPIRTVKTQRHY